MKETKKLKYLIIFSLIIIIAIIIAIIMLKVKSKEEQKVLFTPQDEEGIEYQQSIELERYEFNYVTSAIQAYIDYANKNNSAYYGSDGKVINEDEILYELLTDNYIQKNNKELEKYEEKMVFIPIHIKRIKREDISTFIAEGIVENLNYEKTSVERYIVYIEPSTMLFAIEPSKEKYEELENNIQQIEKIEEKRYNKIKSSQVNVENISNKYYIDFKRLCLSAPEIAYQYLDKEYREARFGNVENFKQYIEKNKDDIKKYAFTQYQSNIYKDYTEYVCLDQYQNHYIFSENKILDYTVKLDTYTIITEKFKQEYDKANKQNKVMMNADKWIQMINNRDYTSAYNVLDQNFRNNKFGAVEQFENYMKENYPLHYKAQYSDFTEENGTYTLEILLSDITGEDKNEKQITVIMQLKEDYEFVMSFNVE